MAAITPSTTLADIVTERPGSAAVLDRLGLDYCCGGQRPLAAAVADRGLALDDVVAELDAQPAESSDAAWAGLSIGELVDHLVATHHAYLHVELPRLDALAEKVAGVHGDRHPELHEVRRLVAAVRADLEPHLFKEEHVLFPMIRELAGADSPPTFHCGTLRNPIAVMDADHDRAGELLATLRRTTGDYQAPADGCASYRALYDGLAELEADTHLHVHKENNVLFPAVLAAEEALAGSPA
jgi:regulator of cell morphogenesis and NO signaling